MYRHPLLLVAGTATVVIAEIYLGLEGAGLQRGALALVAIALYGILFLTFRSGHRARWVQAYLVAQIVFIGVALALWPVSTAPGILFNVLAVHVALLLPPRRALVWIALIALVAGAFVLWRRGSTWDTLLDCVGQTIGYLAYALVGGALRRAEEMQQRSQTLLAELQQAHAQLRDHAAQAQQLAVLEERGRLARDLHDSAKQQAFALAAQLGAARTLLAQPDGRSAAGTRLAEAEQISDGLRRELEGLIQALRPPALEGQGLAQALTAYAADWSRQTSIRAEVHAAAPVTLPAPVELALFRIAQEALANIARHSRARQATLALACADGRAVLRISDDGAGFDPARARAGLGLASMRERAEALRGSLAVASAPAHGTTIEASVPCL
jgi:signal transduction histidine kinase